MTGVNLQGANLQGANLKNAIMERANLQGANMQYIDMERSRLQNASMQGVNMQGANLKNAKMQRADLSLANMQNAYLHKTNLTDANLTGTDLTGVVLWRCIGDGKRIKNIDGLLYPIAYTSEVLQIGCINHTFEEWKNFTEEEIYRMDGDDALEFYKEHKDYILTTIIQDPAQCMNAQIT
jgi:uncharacterized protein YjbI with pentapeptide repeats